jgi:hypothetical protein
MKAQINLEDTNKWLMRGNLSEVEVQIARTAQIEAHKKNLTKRKSLQKGGSLIACDAL